MTRIKKELSVGLIVLFVLSVLIVFPVIALETQTNGIPKPAIPEFTIRYVNNSYFKPETPVSSVNPYTGEVKTWTEGGYLVKNLTIEVTIKHQSFPPTINNSAMQLYYNFRLKGPYEQGWSNLNLRSDDQVDFNYLPAQNSAGDTVIDLPANTYAGGTVQLEVRAILGGTFVFGSGGYPYSQVYTAYATSDWSNLQTIKVAANTAPNITPSITPYSPTTTAPNYTQSPNSVPNNDLPVTISLTNILLIAIVFLLVIIALILLYRRKASRS